MFDIKTIEFGTEQKQAKSSLDAQQQQQHHQLTVGSCEPHLTKAYSTCSIITSCSSSSNNSTTNTTRTSVINPAESTHMTLLSLRRRRVLQRRACLLSILAAFVFGLALGVFMPMFGLSNVFTNLADGDDSIQVTQQMLPVATASLALPLAVNQSRLPHPPSDFPTIYAATQPQADNFAVAFIKEQELSAEEVFRNAFHLEQDKSAPDAMIVKKLDANDGSIKEFRVQRTSDGLFRKGPERRLSKPTLNEQVLQSEAANNNNNLNLVPLAQRIAENARNAHYHDIIKADIYWGDLIERALPKGFSRQDASDWNYYVSATGAVERLEVGCGRMQNRLVVFKDGTRACARYRQNTDQIQGELFSFYLGQLLNLTNLAPSAASVIDLDSRTWSAALTDITQAQWKQQRPVVLTRWLPDLEPAGIPQPFQPLERHLNKYDVWNITLGAADSASIKQTTAIADHDSSLMKRLGAPTNSIVNTALKSSTTADHDAAFSENLLKTSSPQLQRLIELAQWSDLIVFDYLIANLDRVVNNLYNYQWNADIMAAPAHNLARQTNSQLLVFLDNESGLLHGYRLLKKYEAYHGLLLDNLCVFRQPTIEALQELRTYGVGRRLRERFEETTSAELRDVLPSLPDKSIKILIDRIDRVLGQVQKCRDLLAER